jgi:hypothetical protein
MKIKFKVKNKTELWGGELEIEIGSLRTQSSHSIGYDSNVKFWQDDHDKNGNYIEDPNCQIEDFEIDKESMEITTDF